MDWSKPLDKLKLADAHVVIQAGGKGVRLNPLTIETPKPLLAVGGIPMIGRLASQILAEGARRLTVITGYQGDKIQQYLRSRKDLEALELDFITEDAPMGNVGALAKLPLSTAPVVLAFGDLVTDLSFAELMKVHTRGGADVTLASHYEEHRLQLGELVVRDREVIGYNEKPSKTFLICSGIGVFEAGAVALLQRNGLRALSDWITSALAAGFHVTHWVHGAFWRDVNSIDVLREANLALPPTSHSAEALA
jgi:NDP-mannose synthase